jgi:hypothetical protein
MTNFRADRFCDGCGVEITWAPFIVEPASAQPVRRRGEYCCQDCSEGLRCKCSERILLDEERRKPSDLPDIPG